MAAASIRDVAQHAGVSVGTVSNVLNRPGEVSSESITRVHRAIEELGYVRNDAARKLRGGVSTTVGFVVLDGQNPFFGDVVRGAEDEASRHGIAVLYGNTDEDVARERMYLDLFEEQQVRGVLISPYGDINPAPRTPARPRHPRGARRPVQRRRPVQFGVGRQRRRRPDGGGAPHRDRPAAHRVRRRPVRDPAGHRSARRCAGGRREQQLRPSTSR